MKTAAITGILGQDGTYLARWLIEKGYEVHGLIRLPYDREEARIKRRFPAKALAQIHFHTGSLDDPFSIMRFLEAAKPAEVYHLAGVSDSRQSFMVPEQTLLSITAGTLRLLEAGRVFAKDARFFLASSSEVFGQPTESPQNEQTRRQPITPYGVAKVAADSFASLHRRKYDQFVCTGILYNHESPLRPPNYLSRRLAQSVAAIAEGRASELVLGDLEAERDWSDARDFVQGYWLALQVERPDDYIFASGQRRQVREFVEQAFAVAGLDYRQYARATAKTQDKTQVALGLCGDPARARRELNWSPAWDFPTMVKDLVQAELEHRSELERAMPGGPIARVS
jgi:GDPmannose 4,6-dehydratase